MRRLTLIIIGVLFSLNVRAYILADKKDFTVNGQVYVHLQANPYQGSDSDPYNGDTAFSESIRVANFSIKLYGRAGRFIKWWARTGLRENHVTLGETALMFTIKPWFNIIAGRINNPMTFLTSIPEESLFVSRSCMIFYMSIPFLVNGVVLNGDIGPFSYNVGYVPADLKSGEISLMGSVRLSPFDREKIDSEVGPYSTEKGYGRFRLDLGAGGMVTFYRHSDESYVRWAADMIMQYKGFSMNGGYIRFRHYHFGSKGYVVDVNQGGYMRLFQFVIPDTLLLDLAGEFLHLDAPMTTWASHKEFIATTGLIWIYRKGLLRLGIEYTKRQELDSIHLSNDSVMIWAKLLLR